jgi:hypothetical protein
MPQIFMQVCIVADASHPGQAGDLELPLVLGLRDPRQSETLPGEIAVLG